MCLISWEKRFLWGDSVLLKIYKGSRTGHFGPQKVRSLLFLLAPAMHDKETNLPQASHADSVDIEDFSAYGQLRLATNHQDNL